MDPRSIVLYLHLKGLSVHAVHDDLVATFGPKAVADNTVTRYLCEAKLGTADVTLDPSPSLPRLDDSDHDLLIALEEWPFSSVRKLARAAHISGATVYRRLTKSLEFVRYLLR
jgi:hypothetical protein